METTRAKAPFDRRVRRTRAAIKQSYLSLCSRKPSGQITVKEVMSLANVNRATFYAHFANLEELTAAIEVDAAEHIEARCEEEFAGKDLRSAADIACAVCAAAMGEPDELRRVVSHGSTGRGRDLLREKAWSRWSAALGDGNSAGQTRLPTFSTTSRSRRRSAQRFRSSRASAAISSQAPPRVSKSAAPGDSHWEQHFLPPISQ